MTTRRSQIRGDEAGERQMSFAVELPTPVSANNLFANRKDGKGRFKTKTYENWQRTAALTIVANVPASQRIGGPVTVCIELPNECGLDIDNAIKPILDALVHSRRIDDDRHVARIEVTKNARPGDLALVLVRAA